MPTVIRDQKLRFSRGWSYWEGQVWFVYHDGTYVDHADVWQGTVDDPEEIVAAGSVTTYMDRSALDLKKQVHTAKFLRDHYDAVLYEPQLGQVVTH